MATKYQEDIQAIVFSPRRDQGRVFRFPGAHIRGKMQ